VVDGIKEAADVGIEHPGHPLTHQRRVERVECQMGVSPRPEAVGEPEEVGLIDGAEQFGDGPLDDLVFQGRHAERSLPSIGFRDEDPSHRLRPVAAGVDACVQVLEIRAQILLVRRHGHPIDSRAGLPSLPPERPFQGRRIDVVQQGGEPGMDGSSSRRVHPDEVRRIGDPALCPAPSLRAQVPFGPVPSLGASRFLRRRHWYYEPVRLPTSARTIAPAVPCDRPPPETSPAAPVGPLMFR